jgi:DNA (cytosine-5)-methyltransferase 1
MLKNDKSQTNSPNYLAEIDSVLKPAPPVGLRVLDLFAGAGGLSLGFEAAGFSVTGYEMDPDCCLTYNSNLQGICIQAMLDTETEYDDFDVVIGGPPCQPFSVAGRQQGKSDTRNGFPAFIAAVEKIRPKVFVAENVRGLFYRNREYVNTVCFELEELGYVVETSLLNAVDYGVPQNRERVLIVGHDGSYKFPSKRNIKVAAGDALGALALEAPTDGSYLTPSMDRYIANYEAKSKCVNPRDLHLDRPSRTLTCRNLAGATSDMMRIRLPDGRRRRLSIAEASRLQSFPDWWEWHGSNESVLKQIGNSVAPLFAYAVADSIRRALLNESYLLQPNEQLRLI